MDDVAARQAFEQALRSQRRNPERPEKTNELAAGEGTTERSIADGGLLIY